MFCFTQLKRWKNWPGSNKKYTETLSAMAESVSFYIRFGQFENFNVFVQLYFCQILLEIFR